MYKKGVSILLLVCWMTTIFLLSAEPAVESSKSSDRVEKIIVSVAKTLGYEPKPDESFALHDLTKIVRKSAHFFLYFVLGLFSAFVLYAFEVKKRIYIYAVFMSAFYAVTDEIHQLFVEGRSAQVTDVLIDTAGATLAVLILWSMICISRKRKNIKKLTK